MRQAGTACGVRLWAVRLLMVCALAVCAGVVRAPMHSPDRMPSTSSVAMTTAGYSADAATTSVPVADAHANLAQRTAAEAVCTQRTDGPGQDTGCGCCAHGASCCVATIRGPSPSGCDCPRGVARDESFALAHVGLRAIASLAAPPSLSELSLLRI